MDWLKNLVNSVGPGFKFTTGLTVLTEQYVSEDLAAEYPKIIITPQYGDDRDPFRVNLPKISPDTLNPLMRLLIKKIPKNQLRVFEYVQNQSSVEVLYRI